MPVGGTLSVGGQEMVGGVPHVLAASSDPARGPELHVYRVAGGSWAPLGGEISGAGNVASRAMTVVGGEPWVAWSESGPEDSLFQARVSRWTGTAWERVGGVVAQDPDEPGGDVAIGAVGGVAHVMWNERGARLAAHVARWTGSRWEELGTSVSAPDALTRVGSVAEFEGRPHVAWTEQDAGGPVPWRVRVARWTGSAWEPVGEAPNLITDTRVDDPALVAAGGRLHIVWRQAERAWVARFDGGAWRALGEGAGGGTVTSVRAGRVGGVLLVARVEDGALRVARLRPDASGFDDVAGALNADAGQRAGAPALAALGDVPWIAFGETLAGGGAKAHLSRLLPELGTPSSTAAARSAELRVPVRTFGLPFDVRFDFGRGAPDTPGASVRVTSPPSSSALASATLEGLEPGAQYAWRATAGEVTGPVAGFRTAAAAGPAATATPEPSSGAPPPALAGRTRERSGRRRSVSDRVAPDRAAAPPLTPGALQPGGSGARPSPGGAPAGTPNPPAPAAPAGGQTVPLGTAAQERDRRRSRFASSLLRPDDVPLSFEDVARGVGLAMLLAALLGLPARLFNATWKANRLAMARFFAPLARVFRVRRGRFLLGLAPVSALVSALIISFLDPGFPSASGSAAMYLGALLGVGVLLTALFLGWLAFRRRHMPDVRVDWHVYPGQIAFAAVCVAVSRAAHFVPGLIMGMSGDYEVKSRLEVRQAGLRIFYMMRTVGVVALVAWLLSIPVGSAAAGADPSFAVLVLDVMLAVVAVAGMEYLVFSGIPLVFLDGHDLFTWSRARWAAVWGSALLWFSLVVLNPALSHYTDRARASAAWLATLLVVQAVIAVVLWGYFSRRARSAAMEPAA